MSIIIIFLQIKKNPQVLLLIKSDRGRSLPLPDHRDTSLISRHCRSMTVARRMPARASTAVALRAYRAKKRGCRT